MAFLLTMETVSFGGPGTYRGLRRPLGRVSLSVAVIFLVQSAHIVPGLDPYIAIPTFIPLISLDGFKEKCHVIV